MKYVNGFQINMTGSECFITFVVSHPDGKGGKLTEDVETLVMNEGVARQATEALKELFSKIDSDRAGRQRTPEFKKDSNVKLS